MKAVLMRSAVFERLVAFDQRALDALRIGDIVIGEKRAAIRKRQRGAGDDAAVGPVELALIGAPLGEDRGDGGLGALPFQRMRHRARGRRR